jgi:hypothetical protein
MSMECRKHARRMDAATAVSVEEMFWLRNRRFAESTRLGVEVPPDPMLLDVLQLIDVDEAGAWRWQGVTNNHGTPTLRLPGQGERTVVRYLAIAFGLITDGDYGQLYPQGDRNDVNPWKRKLRRSEKPAGNLNRYRPWNSALTSPSLPTDPLGDGGDRGPTHPPASGP